MNRTLSYELSRLAAKVPPAAVVWTVILGGVAAVTFVDGSAESSVASTANMASPAVDSLAVKCQSERAVSIERYQSLLKTDPWQAATSIRRCADKLKDPELIGLVAAAERADLMKTLQNSKALPDVRLDALDRLVADGQPLSDEWRRLRADLVKKVAANEAKIEKARLTQKKKEGVRIGASMDDALQSSWGKPERVNRTVTAHGTREQWVYGGGNYLYFRNGVLESIQTGN